MVDFMLNNDGIIALEFDTMLLTVLVKVIHGDSRMTNYVARYFSID